MNRIDAQQSGGFPLETDTLDFLQKSFTALQSMASLGGDDFILSGCVAQGTNVADGWVVIKGELLPFIGGLQQTKVVIKENKATRNFENGANKVVFYERYAQFGTGEDFTLFSDLVRIKDLKTFRNLPHQSSNEIGLDSELHLATSKAVKAVYDALKNQIPVGGIIMWSGSIATIPIGWALCDGVGGRPKLIDRFIIGAGNDFAVGDFDGERTHKLTIDEMPRHSHGYREYSDVPGDTGDNDDHQGFYYSQTSAVGGDQPHNNMPPYFALAYIIKL